MARKKREHGFFAEFKKFITRGNVLDMAVGVIIGGAFTGIVNGLSNYILKPIINWVIALFMGEGTLENALTFLGSPAYLEDGTIDLANSIYIDWGAFISAVINFFLVAFVLFLIVRTMNNIAKAKEDVFGENAKSVHREVKKIRKEQSVSWDEALVIYANRVAEAKAVEEARLAEEKAMANTKLLEEIRDLLKQK